MLTKLPSHSKLLQHFEKEASKWHMKEMFESDSKRFEKFSLSFKSEIDSDVHLLFDYSKNIVSEKTLELLLGLAKEANVEEMREKMFKGEAINFTEDRAVLHTALRNVDCHPIPFHKVNVMELVQIELKKIQLFTDSVREGKWTGYTGKRITDIINIGIGGSDLGPSMVCTALEHYSADDIKVHFVSNIDGTHMAEVLKKICPETCMFIVVSKTFTTIETMTNAQTAKNWFIEKVKDESMIQKHFVAVSTNDQLVQEFGIEQVFRFWDWVGGRYSVWSSVGLVVALYVGYPVFIEFLAGANSMDQHFKNTELSKNIPVIMALLGIWYNNYFGAESMAVLPYEQYLSRFSAYLQQADMESNGKSVTRNGEFVDYSTGPIIWGEPGTNGQHAFYQLIHQGTKLIPADFLIAIHSLNPVSNNVHHKLLVSNCFAQTEALMTGKSEETVAKTEKNKSLVKHKTFKGNKPTNTIMYNKLTPGMLGALIAMYEHKIFVQGIIWDVNSFDQWGVELGKELAKVIMNDMTSGLTSNHDCSTEGLLKHYLNHCL